MPSILSTNQGPHRMRELIGIRGGRLHLNQEFLSDLCRQAGVRPIAIISTFGKYREGKTFWANVLLKGLQNPTSSVHFDDDDMIGGPDNIPFKSGMYGDTKGIVAWSKVFSRQDEQGNEMAVILLDVQGTFDLANDLSETAPLVVIASLLSSALVDVSCPLQTMISFYVGADPGLAKNPKHLLLDMLAREDPCVDSRSSVASVFAWHDDCYLCLQYGVFSDDDYENLYPDPYLFSSSNYLWALDDLADFPGCQSLFVAPTSFYGEKAITTIDFISFEGINLTITGFHDLFGNNICYFPTQIFERRIETAPKQPLRLDGNCFEETGIWVFEIEFVSLHGVQVNVTGLLDRFENFMCKFLPTTVYQESFVSLPGETQIFEGSCLQIDWCPVMIDQEQRFGFKVLLTARRVELTIKDCYGIYNLTEQEPHVILNPFNIFVQTSSECLLLTETNGLFKPVGVAKLICVLQDCSDDSKCPLLVDLALNCPAENWDWCGDPSDWQFILINGEVLEMTNCTFWGSPLNQSLIIQCRIVIDNQVFFRGISGTVDKLFLISSISVRSLEWTNPDERFFLMPDSSIYVGGLSVAMVLPRQATPSWFSMSLWLGPIQVLSNFRSVHGFDQCEYRLINGPPDPNNLHPERHVFTFRDKDRFVEQFLDAELTSIYIPSGCAPSIALVPRTPANALFDKSQELCDGVSMIVSHGYKNPFEFVTRPSDYYVNRMIACPNFNIDATVEVLAVGTGNLTIRADDEHFMNRSVCDLDRVPPFNCTISSISNLAIEWIPRPEVLQIGSGCYLLVHVSKSSIPFDFSTTTEIVPITKSLPFPRSLAISHSIIYLVYANQINL